MKFKSLIALFLITTITIAQESDNTSLFSTGSSVVQVPLSPEAGTLERFGGLPLNGSTGQMNYSIPFYTISVDGNSWPVSLNYNYGGLILEGKQSLNGLGWSLSATGAVTREVRGLPDESEYGYYSSIPSLDGNKTVQDLIADYLSGNNGNGGMENWSYQPTMVNFLNGIYDSEVDKYTVNVGGMHFSFKIGFNNEAIFLSKHSNRVIIEMQPISTGLNNPNQEVAAFTVIDTKGVKYHFETKERLIPNSIDAERLFLPISSWNLDYIEYLNGQKIEFDYTLDLYDDYNYSAVGAVTFATVQQTIHPNPIFVSPTYIEDVTVSRIERQLLDAITFPKGYIDFSFTSQSTDAQVRKLHKSIALTDKSNNPIKKFDFEYSGNRDYLDVVKRNDSVYFQFDYYRALALPEFINSEDDKALAQDYWKFYNGQSGNQYAINIPNSPYTSNKEPSFTDTRLGALKNIIYPTKGYTQISYGQNQIVSENVLDSEYYDNLQSGKKIFVQFTGAGGAPYDPDVTNYEQKSENLVITQPTLATISHSLQVKDNGEADDIQFEISRSDGLSWYPVTYNNSTIPEPSGSDLKKYYNAATYLREQIQQRGFPFTYPPMYPTLVEQFEGEGGLGRFTREFNSGNKILIMPGTYTFRIKSDKNLTTTASGSIYVQFFGNFNEELPQLVNKDVGGVRVSQLKDCPGGDSSKCVTRDFSYNDENGLSTGQLSVIPQRKTIRTFRHTLPTQPNVWYSKEVHQFLSNPFTIANPSIGTPLYYKAVKEKNSGLSGVGYVERKFRMPREETEARYPKRPTGKDLDKAVQEENLVFEEGVSNPVSSSKTTFDWIKGDVNVNDQQDFNSDHPWSLKIYVNQGISVDFASYTYPLFPNQGDIQTEERLKNLHSVVKYREIDSWDRTAMVESEQDGMVSSIEYVYNEDQQLMEEKIIDSKGNIIKKEIFYPKDFLDNTVFQTMVTESRNQISQPVLTKSFYNGQLMGQTKIDYAINVNGYKPSLTYSAKGTTDLEPRLALSYDNQGNILQVDQLAKSPTNTQPLVLRSTAYVWGYDSEYLIAKVENTTKSLVDATGYSQTVLNSLSSSSEDIQEQLETIRNGISGSLITSYTYKPLIGIKNITDPRGYIMNYSYDDFNRLKAVKDAEGNLLTDYEYHYKSEF